MTGPQVTSTKTMTEQSQWAVAAAELLLTLPRDMPFLYVTISLSGIGIQVPAHIGDEALRADVYWAIRTRLDDIRILDDADRLFSEGHYLTAPVHLYAPLDPPAGVS